MHAKRRAAAEHQLEEVGARLRGLMPSPLRGPAGNVEFLAWWELGLTADVAAQASAIAACLDELSSALDVRSSQ